MIPPPPAWPAGPVTVVGDAIHLAPGFGGNLAMQDAHHLCEALIAANHGRLGLRTAIGAYEDTMRRNGFPSVGAEAGA
jgi:2-polyprenyl-6-methoxyphenol hydroxylase-like FAD-dependent oxidoreductase